MIFVYVSAYGTSSKFLPAVEAEELDDLVDPLKEFGGKRYLQFLHGFTRPGYSRYPRRLNNYEALIPPTDP